MERTPEVETVLELGTASIDTRGGPVGIIEAFGRELQTGIADD